MRFLLPLDKRWRAFGIATAERFVQHAMEPTMDTATYVSQEELASAAAEVGVDLVRYCQLQDSAHV